MMSENLIFPLFVLWIIVIGSYNSWLIAKRGITAMRFGRIFASAIDIFLWGSIFQAEQFCWELLIVAALAGFILFIIYGLNFQDCKSPLHAILMTLFQFTGGFIVVCLLAIYTYQTKKKKKE